MTVLIAGGGTGGHVFPMLAVGDAVRALDSEARVVYVGTPRGIEGRAIGEHVREDDPQTSSSSSTSPRSAVPA